MYLVIETYDTVEYNPYYSPTNSYREAAELTVRRERTHKFATEALLKDWLDSTTTTLKDLKVYQAFELNVSRKIVVEIP